MKEKSSLIIIVAVSILLFGGILGIAFVAKKSAPRADYSEFISCLADKGTKFYGASWCHHCKNQKAEFGDQENQLAEKGVYIECSPDGTSTRTQQCIDEGIESYPTWQVNNERLSGNQSLEILSEKTGCNLPKIQQ